MRENVFKESDTSVDEYSPSGLFFRRSEGGNDDW
jgi:hypothetical protein